MDTSTDTGPRTAQRYLDARSALDDATVELVAALDEHKDALDAAARRSFALHSMESAGITVAVGLHRDDHGHLICTSTTTVAAMGHNETTSTHRERVDLTTTLGWA
jgi:hypothetical protein